MGFFDKPLCVWATPDPSAVWARPLGEFPYPVSMGTVILAKTGTTAVAVNGVLAFSSGFEFCLSVRFHDFEELTAGALASHYESLHVGVAYANGDRAANFTYTPLPAPPSQRPEMLLVPITFGGGRGYRDWHYWTWPLPLSGAIAFTCEWPALNITESEVLVDSAPIIDAAKRTTAIWTGSR